MRTEPLTHRRGIGSPRMICLKFLKHYLHRKSWRITQPYACFRRNESKEANESWTAALSERTADMTEDIEEYAEVAQAIQAVEAEEQSQVVEEATEAEEDTV